MSIDNPQTILPPSSSQVMRAIDLSVARIIKQMMPSNPSTSSQTQGG